MEEEFMMMVTLAHIILIGVSGRTCPDILLQYNETCFSQCPNGTKYVEEKSLCVDTCPKSSPILFKEECLSECPPNKRRVGNVCLSLNRKSQNTNQDTHTIFCPKNRCKQISQYCFRLQCFNKCPENTVIYDWMCVPRCLKDKPFSYNETCVRRCPRTHPFVEDSLCVNVCSEGRYLANGTCLENCDVGYYHFNRTCYKQCPSSQPYTFARNGRTKCLSRCPSFTVTYDTRCMLYCPKETPMLLNNKCLSSCPSTHSLMMLRKSKYNEIAVCVALCPSDLLREDNTCVSTCNRDRKLYNGICLRQCPMSHKYELSTNNFTLNVYPALQIRAKVLCLAKCPISYKTYNKSCFPVCPFPHLFSFQNTCVDHCPQSHSLKYGKSCVSKCPKKQDGDTCVNSCTFPKLDQNSVCVMNCSENFPYRLNEEQSMYGTLISVPQKCVKTCPWYLKFRFKNTCVSDCPLSANVLDQGDVCVSLCPETRPYIRFVDFKRTCTNVCPENEVVDNGICKQHCTTKDFQYILNGTCVSECPESYKIIDTKSKKVCQPICNHLKNNTVLYNNACFHDCPSSHPLRLQQKESVVCRSKCPPTYVVDGSRCITHKECSDSGRKVFESICTSTCPNNTYLTIINPNDDVLSNEIFTFQVCNYTCPKEYYKQGNNCTRCLSNSYYIYEDSCLKRCPGGTIVHKSSSYAVPNICDPTDIYWKSFFGYVFLLIFTILCIWSMYCRRRRLHTSRSKNKRYDQDQLSSLEDNDETCLLEVNDTVLDPSIPKQNHNKRYDQLSSLEDDDETCLLKVNDTVLDPGIQKHNHDNDTSAGVAEEIDTVGVVDHGIRNQFPCGALQIDQPLIVLHEMPKENKNSSPQINNVSTDNKIQEGARNRIFVEERPFESTECERHGVSINSQTRVKIIDCDEEETSQKLLGSFIVDCLSDSA